MLVFKKQIDNLKTNHRGVYVLTDQAFRPLSRMSTDTGGQAVVRAQPVCNRSLSSFLPLNRISKFHENTYPACL